MLALLIGCSGGHSGDTAELLPFDCELGAFDLQGNFVPYAESGKAELVLGFQGLLMLVAEVRAEDPPESCDMVASVTPQDEAANGSRQAGVRFDGDGVSDALVLFMPSSTPSAYEGRTAEIAVRLSGPTHTCAATATVTLVDEDDCMHQGFEPECGGTL